MRVTSVKMGESELLPLTGAERYLLTLPEELYHGEDDLLPPTSLSEPYTFSSLNYKMLANAVEVAAVV